MNTSKLDAILAHPHCVGIDNVDYMPHREELLNEQYKRMEADSLDAQKRIEIQHKQYERHLIDAAKQSKRELKLAKRISK